MTVPSIKDVLRKSASTPAHSGADCGKGPDPASFFDEEFGEDNIDREYHAPLDGYDEELVDEDIDQPDYEVPQGCPDWGPPGDRYCYECGEPVDEVNRDCTGQYDDPLAAVLGKCDVCGAPDYRVLGDCPSCGGPVYKFAECFACYNTISEACDFRVSIGHLVALDMEPYDINMMHMLSGGITIDRIEKGSDISTLTRATIVHAERGWGIRIEPLPKTTD